MWQRTVVTLRFIHSLLEGRFSGNSWLQFVTVDSECRVVDMEVYTNIAIAGIFILGIIAVVGIIGNILTFVVFWKGNFKSSTSFLFLSLSLIDSTVLLTVFTNHIVFFDTIIHWLPHDLLIYLQVCGWPLEYLANTATIWMTVLIAVNRYIIVCLPLRASQWCTLSKVKMQLAVFLVLVVVYNIPEIVRRRVVYNTWDNGSSYVAHIDPAMERSYKQFYFVYDYILQVIVMLCLPLFILTLLTIRLIKAMKAHRRMRVEMQHQRGQPDSSMTFSLVIVVIVFIICRTPALICRLIIRLWWWRHALIYPPMDLMNSTLLNLNSAVNFVIYIIINRRFRNVLCATVCRRRSEIPEVTANVMTMRERIKRETGDASDSRLYIRQCVRHQRRHTAAKNYHHKYHEREQPCVQLQIPDRISKDTPL